VTRPVQPDGLARRRRPGADQTWPGNGLRSERILGTKGCLASPLLYGASLNRLTGTSQCGAQTNRS
jgi:hypothetical protein